MAYNDEAVKAKLSTLNETQESIVTVAQWIMFHRRHADRTATLWLERVKDSNAGKRLNLIYLANEVVQQSKARKRDDFLIAFSPFVPEAVAIAFRGAHADIRLKIRRVVEVWRVRNIFDDAIQTAAETRMKEIETSQSSGGKKLLGGSLFSGAPGPGPAAPAELKPLIPLQEAVAKAQISMDDAVTQADKDVAEATVIPVATVHVRVARYNKTLKSLSLAESAVTSSISARQNLITELEELMAANREALIQAERKRDTFEETSSSISALKQKDEDDIVRGLAPDDEETEESHRSTNGPTTLGADEPSRPDAEDLTPPPIEDFTPVASPERSTAEAENQAPMDGAAVEHVSWDIPISTSEGTGWNTPEPGVDLMASLSRPFSTTDMAANDGLSKRQRLAETAPNNSISDLEEDVNNLIHGERNAL